MRVLLAGPDYEENLSIRYLSSSLLAAGHETSLIPFNSSADIVAVATSAQNADLVGLSMCFQSRAQEFLRLAQLIKSRDPKRLIVAGGHYGSCAAEPLLVHHPELDIVVIHEGERTLVEIADALPHPARSKGSTSSREIHCWPKLQPVRSSNGGTGRCSYKASQSSNSSSSFRSAREAECTRAESLGNRP